ncbi:MAG: hypothetical protein HKN76_22270 [Saprospiraceae bacterium]|nr:hypothetical protein [Saprospiraceae bacterium]
MRQILAYYNDIGTDAAKGFQLFSICRQGVGFLVGIILAKSVLTLEDIGTYELWLYLGLILSLVALSGSYQAFTATFPKLKMVDRPQAIFVVWSICWILSLVIALLIYIFKQFIFNTILNIEIIPELGKVLLFLLLHLNAALIPYLFLVKNEAKLFFPFCIFYVLGGVASVGVPLYFGGGLPEVLHGLLLWSMIEQGLLIYLIFKFARLQVLDSYVKSFLILLIPLSFYAGAGMLAQVFDAWLVNKTYSSFAIFAVFKYGARELPGAVAIASAFTASMIVVYAQGGLKSLTRIKSGSRRFMHFFFPLSILLMIFSKSLFKIVYSTEFVESAMVFNTYLLIMISRWLFPQALLIAMEKHRAVFRISLFELVINIGLSLLLVPYLGLVGIALGTVIAFWAEKILMMLQLKIRHNIAISEYVPVKIFALYSGLLLVSYLLSWI